VKALKDASPAVPVLVGGQVAGVPGLGETVAADGVAHSLAEAIELARARRPA
jgi:hypothetical protein